MALANRYGASRRSCLRGLAAAALCLKCRFGIAGPVRRLTIIRAATGEKAYEVPFWRDGAPDRDGLAQLNWLMRDVQAGEVKPIDLRIYYVLAMLQAEFGGRPIGITSGYRTEATNDSLIYRGIDAARNSFHLWGQAADVQIRDVTSTDIGALGQLLGLGGVGVYPSFVHLDSGPTRFWRN